MFNFSSMNEVSMMYVRSPKRDADGVMSRLVRLVSFLTETGDELQVA